MVSRDQARTLRPQHAERHQDRIHLCVQMASRALEEIWIAIRADIITVEARRSVSISGPATMVPLTVDIVRFSRQTLIVPPDVLIDTRTNLQVEHWDLGSSVHSGRRHRVLYTGRLCNTARTYPLSDRHLEANQTNIEYCHQPSHGSPTRMIRITTREVHIR